MGFGFGEEEIEVGPKGIEYNFLDTLKLQNWDKLKVGRNVQSVLTGELGRITSIDRKWLLLEIEWDNGKSSSATKNELKTVIVI